MEIQCVWDTNRQCYGAVKVWKQLRREGIEIARCTVERLMRRAGLHRIRRGQVVRTTVAATSRSVRWIMSSVSSMPIRPNQLWVSDLTYASTWQGWLYVAFVVDVFARRIVGWRISPRMKPDIVLDALEQPLYVRQPHRTGGLMHLATVAASTSRSATPSG